jgi:hypothetical protein
MFSDHGSGEKKDILHAKAHGISKAFIVPLSEINAIQGDGPLIRDRKIVPPGSPPLSFPEPVAPTMAMVSPGFISKEIRHARTVLSFS